MSAETFFTNMPDDWGKTLTALYAFDNFRPMMGLDETNVQEFILRHQLSPHAAMAVYFAFVFRGRDNAKKAELCNELLYQFARFAQDHGAYDIRTIHMLLKLLLLADKETAELITTAHQTKVALEFTDTLRDM
jgi:hypothetical protein